MAETTTVRVHTTTRDAMRAAAEEAHLTFDALILEALEARRWRAYHRTADADARRLAGDPREREWAARVRDDMDAMEANELVREGAVEASGVGRDVGQGGGGSRSGAAASDDNAAPRPHGVAQPGMAFSDKLNGSPHLSTS